MSADLLVGPARRTGSPVVLPARPYTAAITAPQVPDLLADRRCLGRLWLLVLAVYLLTMAGRLTSGDGETVYQTTRALVTQGRLAIEPRPETAVGRGGRSYGKYGLAQSLVQLPFFVVGHGAGTLAGATDDRSARFAVGMTNGVVSATLVGVFWLLLRALDLRRRPATALALVFAFATLTWPYARADFAEPLQAFSLVGVFYCLVRWRRRAALHWAALAGAAAALAVLTKAASLVVLPPLGAYFAVTLWQRYGRGRTLRPALPHAAAAAVPFLAAGLLQAALNVYRFGSVTEFGYGAEPSTGFTTPVATGVQYLLLSSGKGLLLFAPPTLLGLALLPLLARRLPLEAATAGSVFLAELLYYARWWAWHGDWSWGPRYLVVVVPFAMVGWVPLLAGWWRPPAALRAIAVLLAAAGLLVSVLGTAIDYGGYYSIVADQIGRGVNVSDARLVPPFSPLLGHAWLLRASVVDAAARLRSGGAEPDPADNPALREYPWAAVRPDLVPEAPERAVRFDYWFAALPGRSPFQQFWSGLVATWLALALVPLAQGLWSAAGQPTPATTRPRPTTRFEPAGATPVWQR